MHSRVHLHIAHLGSHLGVWGLRPQRTGLRTVLATCRPVSMYITVTRTSSSGLWLQCMDSSPQGVGLWPAIPPSIATNGDTYQLSQRHTCTSECLLKFSNKDDDVGFEMHCCGWWGTGQNTRPPSLMCMELVCGHGPVLSCPCCSPSARPPSSAQRRQSGQGLQEF